MDRAEVARRLRSAGIRPGSYSLNGGMPDERLCLSRETDTWHVYYSERGQRSWETVFDREEDACEYFWRTITRDPSSWWHPKP